MHDKKKKKINNSEKRLLLTQKLLRYAWWLKVTVYDKLCDFYGFHRGAPKAALGASGVEEKTGTGISKFER